MRPRLRLARSRGVEPAVWSGRGASAWVTGVGIHTGEPARVRFHRVPGEPVAFLVGRVRVPPLAEFVTATALSTELGVGRARISTVEHLLAALHVLGHWTGLAVEVEGPELPILDGSARGWAAVLARLSPEPAPPPLRPADAAVEVRGGYAGLEPHEGGLELQVSVAYPHPAVGEQTWGGGKDRWPDLLDARTFGFERDLERLWSQGRALGARPDNAVVYGAAGPSLPPRGADEVVRHKALDLLGDLYLVGAPLAARVVAERASHAAHVALARAVRGG